MFREYLKLRRWVEPPYRYLFWGLVATIVAAATGGVSLTALVPLMNGIFTRNPIVLPAGFSRPAFLQILVNSLNAMDPITLVRWAMLFLIVTVIIKGIAMYYQNYCFKYFSYRILTDLRLAIYQTIQHLSLEFFSRKRSGEIAMRIIYDVGVLENVLSREFPMLFFSVCQIAVYFLILFRINVQLTILSMFVFPFLILPIINLGKKLRKLSRNQQVNYANLGNIIQESVYGQQIIKAYNREQEIVEKFSRENESLFRFTMSIARRSGLVNPFSELLTTFAGAFIIYLGVRAVLAQQFSSGFLVLFIGALVSLISPAKAVVNAVAQIFQASAALPRVYGILEETPSVADSGNTVFSGIREAIILDDVHLSYGATEILKGVSLHIKAGQHIGIVGPVGSGKSSLVGLLLRFYQPQSGRILFDGRDVREFSLTSIREQVGLVTQEPILFSDTIRNNITFGAKHFSAADFERAVHISHVADFVEKLPGSYETVVGERGTTLSGGQKQLICLARALLRNPSILIFDEITASLDSQSEQMLYQALEEMMKDRTVIFVAHRLATVRNLDRIFVLINGVVKESGSHDQLIAKEGLYARMWALQQHGQPGMEDG